MWNGYSIKKCSLIREIGYIWEEVNEKSRKFQMSDVRTVRGSIGKWKEQ